jgi:hypothetical protein
MRELKTMLGNLENHDVEMNGFNSSWPPFVLWNFRKILYIYGYGRQLQNFIC